MCLLKDVFKKRTETHSISKDVCIFYISITLQDKRRPNLIRPEFIYLCESLFVNSIESKLLVFGSKKAETSSLQH
jgi:hypothetical protein